MYRYCIVFNNGLASQPADRFYISKHYVCDAICHKHAGEHTVAPGGCRAAWTGPARWGNHSGSCPCSCDSWSHGKAHRQRVCKGGSGSSRRGRQRVSVLRQRPRARLALRAVTGANGNRELESGLRAVHTVIILRILPADRESPQYPDPADGGVAHTLLTCLSRLTVQRVFCKDSISVCCSHSINSLPYLTHSLPRDDERGGTTNNIW